MSIPNNEHDDDNFENPFNTPALLTPEEGTALKNLIQTPPKEEKPASEAPDAKKEAPDKPAETKKLTTEELSDRGKQYLKGLGYRKRSPSHKEDPDDKEVKKEEPAQKDEPAHKPDTKEAKDDKKPDEATTKKVVVKKKSEPAPIDEQAIANLAATTAAETVARLGKGADREVKAAAADEFALTDREKDDVEAMKLMAEMNPTQYATIAIEWEAWLKKLKAYKKKWETDNPGKRFNKEEDAHDEFFANNLPEMDDEDFLTAKTKLAEIRTEKKLRSEFEPALKEIEEERKAKKAEPLIQSRSQELAMELAKVLGDDVPEMIKKNDTAGLTARLAKDPVAKRVMQEVSNLGMAMMRDMTLFFDGGNIKYDPTNQIHTTLATRAWEVEQAIRKQPVADQTNDAGQRFVTRQEWDQLTEDQRKRAWKINGDVMAAVIAQDLAEMARKNLETKRQELKEYNEAMGISAQPASKPSQEEKSKEEAKPKAEKELPKSPAVTDSVKTDTSGKSGGGVPNPLKVMAMKGLGYA